MCEWHATRAVRMAKANALPVSIRGAGHNAAVLGICDEGMTIDLSPINSASSDPEFDFLDESGNSQFPEWLEESWLCLKAGQDPP